MPPGKINYAGTSTALGSFLITRKAELSPAVMMPSNTGVLPLTSGGVFGPGGSGPVSPANGLVAQDKFANPSVRLLETLQTCMRQVEQGVNSLAGIIIGSATLQFDHFTATESGAGPYTSTGSIFWIGLEQTFNYFTGTDSSQLIPPPNTITVLNVVMQNDTSVDNTTAGTHSIGYLWSSNSGGFGSLFSYGFFSFGGLVSGPTTMPIPSTVVFDMTNQTPPFSLGFVSAYPTSGQSYFPVGGQITILSFVHPSPSRY